MKENLSKEELQILSQFLKFKYSCFFSGSLLILLPLLLFYFWFKKNYNFTFSYSKKQNNENNSLFEKPKNENGLAETEVNRILDLLEENRKLK